MPRITSVAKMLQTAVELVEYMTGTPDHWECRVKRHERIARNKARSPLHHAMQQRIGTLTRFTVA